jgi:hypothetical protein
MAEQSTKPETKATLSVGGHKIPVNPFVESALVGVVDGFLSALRDVGPGEVTIVIPAERRSRSTE